MLLTFGFANAQCKIYSSSKSYGGNIVGYIDGSKIYSSSKSYGGNIVGYIDGSKILLFQLNLKKSLLFVLP